MKDDAVSVSRKERQPASDAATPKPLLAFFYSPTSGRCERTHGHLAHTLQRRHNHDAFHVVWINVDDDPALAQRFKVDVVPTLVVVEERRVVKRIVTPRSALELERELAPWLR